VVSIDQLVSAEKILFSMRFNVKLCSPLVAILDRDQNHILREQDNMLWEHNNILREQYNMLWEQNIVLVGTK